MKKNKRIGQILLWLKKHWFLLSACLFIIVGITQYNSDIGSNLLGKVIKTYSRYIEKKEIEFSSLHWEKNTLVVDKLSIYDLSANKPLLLLEKGDLHLSVHPFSKKKKVIVDLIAQKPTVYILKKTSSINQNEPQNYKRSQKKRSFIDWKIQATDGRYILLDDNMVLDEGGFTYEKKQGSSQQKISLFGGDTITPFLSVDLFEDGEEKLAYMQTENSSLKKIGFLLDLFLPSKGFDEIEGLCSGSIMLGMKNDHLARVLSSLKMKDLNLLSEAESISFSCDQLELETISPLEKTNVCSPLFSFIPKDLLIRLAVSNGKLTSRDYDSSIETINGSFSYNSSVGPKWEFASNVHDQKMLFSGRGYFHSSLSNWLEVDLSFERDEQNRGAIHVRAKEDQEKNVDLDADIEKIDAQQWMVFTKLFNRRIPKHLFCNIYEGEVSSNVHLKFDANHIEELRLDGLYAENLLLSHPLYPFELGWRSFSGTIASDLSLRGLDAQLQLEGSFCNYKTPSSVRELFLGLSSEMKIESGKILPAKIGFSSHDLQGTVQVEGLLDQLHMDVSLQGNNLQIADLFSMDIQEENQPYVASLSLDTDRSKTVIQGSSTIGDREKLSWDIKLLHSLLVHLQDPFNVKRDILSLDMDGERINLDRCFQVFPFLKSKGHDLKGFADIQTHLEKDQVTLTLKGYQLKYALPDMTISLEDFSSDLNSHWKIHYDLKKDVYSLFAPQVKGKCFFPKIDKSLKISRAEGKIEGDVLYLSKLQGGIDKMGISGSMTYDYSRSVPQLRIQAENIGGQIPTLSTELMKNPISYSASVNGACDLSFLFGPDEIIKEGYFLLDLFDVTVPYNESLYLEKGQAHIFADFSSDEYYVEDCNAQIVMPSALTHKTVHAYLPLFRGRDLSGKWQYDLRLEDEIHELMRVTGSFTSEKNGVGIHVDKTYSHFLDVPLQVDQFSLDEKLSLSSIHLAIDSSFPSFHHQTEFFLQTGLLPMKGNLSFLPKERIGANIVCDFFYHDKVFDYSLQAAEIMCNKLQLPELQVQGRWKEHLWSFDHISWDGYRASFGLEKNGEHYELENFSLTYLDDVKMRAEGFFREDKFEGQIKDVSLSLAMCQKQLGHFFSQLPMDLEGDIFGKGCVTIGLPTEEHPLQIDDDWDVVCEGLKVGPLSIESKAPFFIQHSLKDGVMFQGLDLAFSHELYDFSGINLKVHHLLYNSLQEKWFFKETKVQLPCDVFRTITKERFFQKIPPLEEFMMMVANSAHFEHPIDVLTNIECSSDFTHCRAEAAEGDFSVNGTIRHFKDLSFGFCPTSTELGFSILYNDRYYTMDNLVNWTDQFFVKTVVSDKENLAEDPLTVIWSWDEKWGLRIGTITGSFCGLSANFYEEDQINLSDPPSMIGSLKMDFTKAVALLPKEAQSVANRLQLGKGFEICGRLKQTPEETEFVGSFIAKKFGVGGYEFQTLFSKLQYSSGQMVIEDFELSDQAGSLSIPYMTLAENKSYFIPRLEIKELRPSLLKSMSGQQQEIQPLVVRKMNFEDLRGNLDEKKSLTGKGSISFINTFKRDYSLLDIPSEVIGRLVGLDMELLIPVRGFIDCEFIDGKCMITKVKKTYSEGKRSKFFLVEGDKPYVDFDGNLNIHIKMKQYVLFKLTENFILSLEGTFDKPHFTMRKKKSFYSLMDNE